MRVSSEIKFEPSPRTRVGIERPPEKDVDLTKRVDPLRRLISTPYTTNLSCMGKCVRLETNDAQVFEHIVALFSIYPPATEQDALFRWRIIREPVVKHTPFPLTRCAFSDSGLRYAEFGQRNFIAIDMESRLAAVFISEELACDRSSLTYPFLDTLFCMCATSLGFTSLFANCIEVSGQAILLLGPSRSGKTTVSYLAAKQGMHFCADDGVFLEMNRGNLQAWGGFWPALIREEVLEFCPEIRTLAESFSYGDFVFRRLERHSQRPRSLQSPVKPHCCVFLNRNTGEGVRVVPIEMQSLRERLGQSLLFDEDVRFEVQQNAVLEILARLPAYEISYAGDPAVVIAAISSLEAT